MLGGKYRLYLAASVAHELGAIRVGFVAPCLAYMRQDARFHSGEGITAKHFARLLSSAVDWLVTVVTCATRRSAQAAGYRAAS